MSNWEKAEFEAQQEAIKKWAEKKIFKICNGWWFVRKCRKIQKLAGIISGDPDAALNLGIRKNYRSIVKIDE